MAEMPNRIRELRIARNWSQDQLAEAAHCSKAQISDLERGNRGLDLDWMRRLAAAFGVTPGELLSQDDNPLLPIGEERRSLIAIRPPRPRSALQFARVAEALIPARAKHEDTTKAA
jgi:transcriptional regulator with XRE-family HTH domain